MKIIHGDCLEIMREMEANSVDAIVTDPPYGLAFMGKKWDYNVPSVEIWQECLRVLKPGGHLLAFGGTRTFHRTVANIEDAGFEVRDMIAWIHGQGFPKSMDVSKAIDKEAGAEREVVGQKIRLGDSKSYAHNETGGNCYGQPNGIEFRPPLTLPATDAARQWQGWGTALKPAHEPVIWATKGLSPVPVSDTLQEFSLSLAEFIWSKSPANKVSIEPICMARKPIEEKTVAKNVLAHGTGAINVDKSRITPQGRFPANIIFDEEAAAALDEQSGILRTGGVGKSGDVRSCGVTSFGQNKRSPRTTAGDSGGASRFFYCAKPSARERGEGNTHPTVKATALMAYLCRLITPPGGLILDPFAGSGTTGIAAIREGFNFVGIEKEIEYIKIMESRIAAANGCGNEP